MEESLTVNNTYLVRYGNGGSISQLTVLMVTDKAYQFRYESGSTGWMLKDRFELDYSVIENITDFIVQEAMKNYDGTFTTTEFVVAEYETCPVCHGTGQIPNKDTTAMFTTCPLCQGNRRVVKRTEVKV